MWFDVVAIGTPGHGALPPRDQASVNLARVVTEVAGFGKPRVHPVLREQFANLSQAASGPTATIFRALASAASGVVSRAVAPKLRGAGALGLLLSDSVTPTVMAAGYKSNVVPGEARASFDARLLPDTDVDAFLSSMDARANRHGASVDNVVRKGHGPVSGKGSLYEVLTTAAPQIVPGAISTLSLSPGITDLRFFRALGASGYGWTPLVLTPQLLATIHGHDERIPVADFERAVTVMADVVARAST
ncbi:MAG TPA: M20/M25/M40 family metallo-hydrolase [Egibacteraceae bacterium]|nr:M20/M25/M40 family metallo-hydrolase [Egibacteraceae bacterium]